MADTQHDIPATSKTIKSNEKKDEDFRVYDESSSEQRVINHYRDMRTFHTVSFYQRMEKKYSFEDGALRRRMTIEKAFDELENYVVRAQQ